jgi:hypothetical protein
MEKRTQSPQSPRVSDGIRKGVERATKQAQKMGGRLAQAVGETPELISLQRNDRALRAEMSESYEKIGKRVMVLYKKSKQESPFERYKAIRTQLLKLEGLESEYRDNKAKLADVKRRIKRGR